MYQAIVFLPLLGAILAGIIALAGAHARHPGGPPADGDHHAAGHSHAAAVNDGSQTHAHLHPQEPAAAGSRTAELITTTLLFISRVLSWIAFARGDRPDGAHGRPPAR